MVQGSPRPAPQLILGCLSDTLTLSHTLTLACSRFCSHTLTYSLSRSHSHSLAPFLSCSLCVCHGSPNRECQSSHDEQNELCLLIRPTHRARFRAHCLARQAKAPATSPERRGTLRARKAAPPSTICSRSCGTGTSTIWSTVRAEVRACWDGWATSASST